MGIETEFLEVIRHKWCVCVCVSVCMCVCVARRLVCVCVCVAGRLKSNPRQSGRFYKGIRYILKFVVNVE